MADNLAADHSDVSTTERGGHDSNIGRTQWRERDQGFEGTAREAPLGRDPREDVRADVVDAVEEVRENEQAEADELRPRRERLRDRAAQRAAQEAVEPDQLQESDPPTTETQGHTPTPEASSSWSREAQSRCDALS